MIIRYLTVLLACLLFSPADSLCQETFFSSKHDVGFNASEGKATTLSLLTFNIWFDSDDWPAWFALMLRGLCKTVLLSNFGVIVKS